LVLANPLDHMAGRQIDLDAIPSDIITQRNYNYLLEDEYIVPEGIILELDEVQQFEKAQDEIYSIFQSELEEMIRNGQFGFLDLPSKMIDLIIYSYQKKHQHVVGRFDFAGGIDGLPIKLLEYNADTPTMIPESSFVQDAFFKHIYKKPAQQYNSLEKDLEVFFNRLLISESKNHPSLIATSLGYPEDTAHAKFIMDIASKEGFDVEYADLQHIIFSPGEGVYLEADNGDYVQADYLYKMIPWEFICFEEPELLDILHDLITNDLVYVMNPAYTLVYQSKLFLDHVSKKYDRPFFLQSSRYPKDFMGKKYVEKVSFGRLGENIKIFDESSQIIEETDGDFGHFDKVYQEFTDLYKDQFNEYYQLGLFNVKGIGSCMSFRRADKLIIDDDAEFIPHFIPQ